MQTEFNTSIPFNTKWLNGVEENLQFLFQNIDDSLVPK